MSHLGIVEVNRFADKEGSKGHDDGESEEAKDWREVRLRVVNLG